MRNRRYGKGRVSRFDKGLSDIQRELASIQQNVHTVFELMDKSRNLAFDLDANFSEVQNALVREADRATGIEAEGIAKKVNEALKGLDDIEVYIQDGVSGMPAMLRPTKVNQAIERVNESLDALK